MSGANLQKKLSLYKGDTALYQRNALERKPYYATNLATQADPASKSRMTEKPFGKHYINPIMGKGEMENEQLPTFVVELAYQHLSQSVTTGTAAQYRAAINVIKPASEYLKIPLNLPFTASDCIALVVYMANIRKFKATTITSYFSAFRMLHLVKGHYNQELRADIVTQLIKGVKNGDQIRDVLQNKQSRQPITIGIMAKLREAIHGSRIPLRRKRLIWFTATTCLLGSFRIHEILPKEQNSFDKSVTLMTQDVSLTQLRSKGVMTKAIAVHLKNPKEDKSNKGVRVDIFETTGPLRWLCAVAAYVKYMDHIGTTTTPQPLATMSNGTGYTGRMFNEDIKTFLNDKVDLSQGPITSHSFRAGLSTMMAKAGCSDTEIKLAGRWTSNAFKSYVKTARPKRAALAASIWTTLTESGVSL